jgi:hypothetical protein
MSRMKKYQRQWIELVSPWVITGPEEQIFALTTRILAFRSSCGQLAANSSQILKDGLETVCRRYIQNSF